MNDSYIELVKDIKLLLSRYPEEFHTIMDVSMKVGYSTYHLSRIFRKSTGNTLGGYMKKTKLLLAAEKLLDANSTVISVSTELGFSSQQAFTRAFTHYFNEPPGCWRKRHKYLVNVSIS